MRTLCKFTIEKLAFSLLSKTKEEMHITLHFLVSQFTVENCDKFTKKVVFLLILADLKYKDGNVSFLNKFETFSLFL